MHWIAPALNFTGYARLNREAILATERAASCSISLDPSMTSAEFIDGLQTSGPDAVAPWNAILGRKPAPGGLCLVSDLPCNLRRLRDTRPGHDRYAGLTMFETDRLPTGWREGCLEMDEIWVPSNFNLRTFTEAGVPGRMLKRIPCGIDMDSFRPGIRPLPVQGRRSFNFLSVFEWTLRKGWDTLLLAWAEAFTVRDDVSLTLKAHLPGGASGVGRAVEEFYVSRGIDPRRIAPVVAIEGFLPESAMPGLYAAADAFVLPTRGEGWGLPYLEAMACGLPAIATGWSAHMDFVTAGNGYVVDHVLAPVAPEQTRMSEYYGPDHLWAEPSREHLVEILRRCAKDPAEVRDRGRRARREVQEDWSSRRTAEWISANASGRSVVAVPVADAPLRPDKRLRIGFDGRTFSVPDSVVRGIGHYALHHLQAILQERPGCDLTVLHDDTVPVQTDVRARTEALGAKWAPWSSRDARDFDVFHTPDPMFVHPGYASPFQRFRGTRITATFHDVIPLRVYEGKVANWPGYLARLDEVRDSGAILLCNSEFTRRDALDAIGLEPSRARAVLAGWNTESPDGGWSESDTDSLLRRLGIRGPFLLHVGATDPHKNFETALSAFQVVRRRGPCQLVVAGKLANSLLSVRDQVEQAGIPDVVFTDFLPRRELDMLYSRAAATLFLSLYEGFGFPALEAMAGGSPLVASNAASIPEVVGDAGLVHDPRDVEGVTASIHRLLSDASLRADLVRRGRERARSFRWSDTARRTWEAWDELSTRELPAPTPPPVPARVRWIAPIWDPSGYADESRGFLGHLCGTDLGAGVLAWGRHSESFRQAAPKGLRGLLDGAMGRETVPGSPVVLAMPASALGRFPGGGFHVGRTTFETDGLPADWVARCNAMDEIWVPCGFNKETFAKAGVTKPILVVPEGVDTDRFRPGIPPLALPGPSRGTTFLAVFEWTHRKGPDSLLRAWAEAFGPGDDVRLVLRTYPPNQIEGDPADWVEGKVDEELSRIGKRRSDCAPIAVIGRQVPDSDMPRLYAAADVFVAPSRGEGWGRPHQEAMSCGVPVVATRWSGNLEFQDDGNSWLVDVEGLVEIDAREEFPFYRGQKWAEPSVRHLAALLREASSRPDLRKAKGSRARADMVGKWDWNRIAPLAETRLREILAGVPADRSAIIRSTPAASKTESVLPSASAGGTGSIRFCGQMFNYSGYARLSREAVAGWMDAGIPVTVDPLLHDANWFKGISDDERSRWTGLLKRPAEPGLLVCCDVPRDAHGRNELFSQMGEANPGCPRKAGWTMFETDRLPAGWAESLNRMDEVWVPSEFNRRTFAAAGVESSRIHVVPGCIDPRPYASARPMALPGPRRGTTFLSVFQWTRRKGWDVLLRAWAKAFRPQADVRLVLRCHPFGKDAGDMRTVYLDSLRELGLKESDLAPVILLDGFVEERDLPGLYAASDVFVLPSRGEGWGLPYLEAMAAGKPCIATAWGASMDFLSPECAWLVPPREPVEVGEAACRENPYLSADHRWADPDPEEVARFLREAASDVELRLSKAGRARLVAARWNPARTARAVQARLDGREEARTPARTISVVADHRVSGALERVAAGLVRGRPAPSSSTAEPQGRPVSVRWEGSQFLHHSLAHVNRELCVRLAKRGHDLSIVPFEPDQFGPGGDPDLSILARLTNAALEGPCQVHVRHQWPPNLQAPTEGRWVVVQPWEFGSPPVDWVAPFRDRVDEIWCYTEHVRRAYLEAGIPASKLRTVPLGVDTERFRPGLEPLPGMERDPARTTFLFVGGTIARKGFDILLNAWRAAFGPTDPVRLVVKDMGGKTTYKGQTGESMVRELNATGEAAPVLYFDHDVAPADLPRLYACADVLVHPYRGEGFGLPVAEAMASGLPVVVTRGGSTDDFCGDAESWGIPAERVPVPGGRVGPFETVSAPWWLEPSVESLVAILRQVAADPAGRRVRGDAARRRILSGWTWDHAAAAAERALVEVAGRPASTGTIPKGEPSPSVAGKTKVLGALAKLAGRSEPRTSIPTETVAIGASTPADHDEKDLQDLNRILFRAEAATARGDLREAEQATREAVEAHPGIALAWLARSMVLRGLGRLKPAAEAVARSLAIGRAPEALLEAALVHKLDGRKDLAKDLEKELKRGHPDWVVASKALYVQRGQIWPLDPKAAPTRRKSPAPPSRRK